MPDGVAPTVTPTATVISSPTAQDSPSGNDNSHLTGPLIAAAVVPTTVFVFIVIGFCLFVVMRRRKLRQLEENNPYPPSPRMSSRPPASTSVIMSGIVDTFVEDPIDRCKRGNAKKPQGFTSLSLLSSNLSASLRSFRGFQESNATMLVNPLTAPPPSRPKTGDRGVYLNLF